jgi:hypothetical protein
VLSGMTSFICFFIKDSINVISSENNVNVSLSKNKRKRIDDISLKL